MKRSDKPKRTADNVLTIGLLLCLALMAGMWIADYMRGREMRVELTAMPTNEEYWLFMGENDIELQNLFEVEIYNLLRVAPRMEVYSRIEQAVESWADKTDAEISEVRVDTRRSLETLWRDDGQVTNQNLFNDYETVVQVVCLEEPYNAVADEVIDALEYDIYGKYMLQNVEVQVYMPGSTSPVYTESKQYPPFAWGFDRNLEHSNEEAARTVAYDYGVKLDDTYFDEHMEKRAHNAATFGLSHFGVNEEGILYVGMRASFEPEGEYSAQFMEALEENANGMADALIGDERTVGWLEAENIDTMIVEYHLDWLNESRSFEFSVN